MSTTNPETDVTVGPGRKRASSIKGEPGVKMEEGRISSEAEMNRLGSKEGMVDVMYCWNVRRDVFEVPMLIVMNVSTPILNFSKLTRC
jgi:hypothetical protein